MCLAIPGEIVRRYQKRELAYAEVRFGGATREVCLHCVPTAEVGDFVLVHVGMAIARVDRDEAARTLSLLRELGEADLAAPGEAP
jgi:hydrogenase expression/formation protein HypC